jgi:phospholipid transport system substrate-binding protein
MTRIAVALTLLCSLAVAAPVSAGPPTDAMQAYVDRLFAVLDDSGLKEPRRAADRQRTIRAVAEDALDFNESARRSLAAHWDARTPAERARFVRLFTDLIDHAYLTRIALDGERIAFDSESITDKEAVVKGRALSKSGGATPVQFFLHQDPTGRWRLYDVSFEGMSLVSNYRAQFNKIIRGSSFDELVIRLEAKTRAEAQASTSSKTP